MVAFAICRIAKLKSFRAVTGSEKHTDRQQETPNANTEIANLELLPVVEDMSLEALVKAKIGDIKYRKDAILCAEYLCSASPEYFRPDHPGRANYYHPDKLEPWVDRTMDWLKKKHGDNLIKATLHLDEVTPHIVAYVVPIHDDLRTKAAPGQKILSYKRDFGGSKYRLSQLQDEYYDAVKDLGLARGIKGSTATHETIADLYSRMQQELPVPDLERSFALPKPQADESADDYHQRLSEHFAQALPVVRDDLKTLEAYAKTAEWQRRKAKDTTITLQALGDKLDDQEKLLVKQAALNQQLQIDKEQLQGTAERAIAAELIVTAQLVLAQADVDYCHFGNFMFDGRGDYLKINTLEGERLVHNKGGAAVITQSLTKEHIEALRQGRQQLAQAAQAAREKSNPQQARGGGR